MNFHSHKKSGIFSAAMEFASAWFGTRSWRLLVLAVPCLLLASVVFGGAVVRPFVGNKSKIARYRAALADAAGEGDVNEAYTHLFKLRQMGAVERETEFKLAMLALQKGEVEHCVTEMARLAPLDKPGFFPAHAWQVKALAAGVVTKDKARATVEIEQHMDRMIELQPDAVQLKVQKAVFWAQSGKTDQARALIAPLAEQYPKLKLFDAEIVAKRDGEAAGTSEIERVASELASAMIQRPLTLDEHATLIEAYRVLQDEEAMETAIADAKKHFPRNDALEQAISDAYARVAATKRGGDVSSQTEMLGLLAKSLDANALNAASLGQLITLAREDSEVGEKAGEILDEIREDKATPAGTRLVTGSEKARLGEYAKALSDLQKVVKDHPESAVAWNNLAWVLGEIGEDLPKARRYADKAVELAPQDLRFLETRGQILVKMKMWKEAVEDLEKALPGFKEDEKFLKVLEEARQKLGD